MKQLPALDTERTIVCVNALALAGEAANPQIYCIMGLLSDLILAESSYSVGTIYDETGSIPAEYVGVEDNFRGLVHYFYGRWQGNYFDISGAEPETCMECIELYSEWAFADLQLAPLRARTLAEREAALQESIRRGRREKSQATLQHVEGNESQADLPDVESDPEIDSIASDEAPESDDPEEYLTGVVERGISADALK
jgi:hypothetical protein